MSVCRNTSQTENNAQLEGLALEFVHTNYVVHWPVRDYIQLTDFLCCAEGSMFILDEISHLFQCNLQERRPYCSCKICTCIIFQPLS